MKNILFILSILICNNLFAEKYALIIAIGDYPEDGRWQDISSTNDVIHIQSSLEKLGFTKNNIQKVIDSEATHDGILQAFENIQQKLKSGDIVYIHYSGHGQQVPDQNGDEIDFLDEAIVPFDSPLYFEKGFYEGDKLIRDDQIGIITNKMRKTCGSEGQLILVLDSCHSGTGVRGMGKVRGTDKIMASKNFKKHITTNEIKQQVEGLDDETLAPIASFYGASPRELNYETKDDQLNPVGSLSYALSSVLSKMSSTYTFEEVFDRVKLKMKALAPRQNPQFEGPKNMRIFDGSTVSKSNSFKVSKIINNTTINVDMGTISDIYEGSTIDLYSVDLKEIVNSGVVSNSRLTSSTVHLNETIEPYKNHLLQIIVKEKSFAPMKLGIYNMVDTASKWHAVVQDLYQIPMLKKTEDCPDLYILEKEEALMIESKEGQLIYKSAFRNNNITKSRKKIEGVLRAHAQSTFLRSYNHEKSAFDFSLSINSVACGNIENVKSSNPSTVKVGECVQFKITNDGITGAYFSLLDIQPDNILNLVIPAVELGYTADEYYLEPGEEYTTDYAIEIAQPLGEEALKLVISKNPLQLHTIISTQGQNTRGISDTSNFEKMLISTYNINTRGTKIKRNPVEEVGTKTLFFNIKQ